MRTKFEAIYYSNILLESYLSFYLLSINSSLSSLRVNFVNIVFKAYLGNFLALTVFIRSGISYDFNVFIVDMNLLCCKSL